MYKYYDYICDDFHRTTKFQDANEVLPEINCPDCGKVAVQCISAPHISSKMGCDPSSAQANRWAKMHKNEAKRLNAKIDPNPSS